MDDDIQYLGSTNPMTSPASPRTAATIVLHIHSTPDRPATDLTFHRTRASVIRIGRRPASEATEHPVVATHDRALFRCAVVSRQHAKIAFSDTGAVYIIDTGSHHGTHLRRPGETSTRPLKPETPAPLHDGDTLTFGKAVGRNDKCVRPIVASVELSHETPFKPFTPTKAPTIDLTHSPSLPPRRSNSGRFGVYVPASTSDEEDFDDDDYDEGISDIEEIFHPASGSNALSPKQPSQALSSNNAPQLPSTDVNPVTDAHPKQRVSGSSAEQHLYNEVKTAHRDGDTIKLPAGSPAHYSFPSPAPPLSPSYSIPAFTGSWPPSPSPPSLPPPPLPADREFWMCRLPTFLSLSPTLPPLQPLVVPSLFELPPLASAVPIGTDKSDDNIVERSRSTSPMDLASPSSGEEDADADADEDDEESAPEPESPPPMAHPQSDKGKEKAVVVQEELIATPDVIGAWSGSDVDVGMGVCIDYGPACDHVDIDVPPVCIPSGEEEDEEDTGVVLQERVAVEDDGGFPSESPLSEVIARHLDEMEVEKAACKTLLDTSRQDQTLDKEKEKEIGAQTGEKKEHLEEDGDGDCEVEMKWAVAADVEGLKGSLKKFEADITKLQAHRLKSKARLDVHLLHILKKLRGVDKRMCDVMGDGLAMAERVDRLEGVVDEARTVGENLNDLECDVGEVKDELDELWERVRGLTGQLEGVTERTEAAAGKAESAQKETSLVRRNVLDVLQEGNWLKSTVQQLQDRVEVVNRRGEDLRETAGEEQKAEKREIRESVDMLRVLVFEMRELKESALKSITAELEAVRTARAEALASIEMFVKQQQMETVAAPNSLKRKRQDLDEDKGGDEDDGSVRESRPCKTSLLEQEEARKEEETVFVVSCPSPEKEYTRCGRKRLRRFASASARTAAAVTVGAIATWGALAFS